jgi:hypothetical protein
VCSENQNSDKSVLGGWATPEEKRGHYGAGRASDRERRDNTREERRSQGQWGHPRRGVTGRRLPRLFARLPRLGLIGSVT